jgi:hypothetical protein
MGRETESPIGLDVASALVGLDKGAARFRSHEKQKRTRRLATSCPRRSVIEIQQRWPVGRREGKLVLIAAKSLALAPASGEERVDPFGPGVLL